MNQVHLHVHSEESKLDGLSKVHELATAAKELGQKAIALTDHGVLGGIPDFIVACEKEGIKPLPGVEAYMTKNRLHKSEYFSERKGAICEKYLIGTRTKDGNFKPKLKAFNDFVRAVSRDWSRFDELANELLADWLMSEDGVDLFSIMVEDEPEEKTIDEFREEIIEYISCDNYHLLLLPINNKGLEEMYEIISDAHVNGLYSDPRTDLSYIRENNLGKNIIATSACLGSYLASLVRMNLWDKACEFIQECKDTFYEFYLEKQAVSSPEQLAYNDALDKLASATNTPKVVTTDAHFARKDDWAVHDVLVASSFKKCVHDTDRYIYSKDHFLKSETEVREIVNDDEAILNTSRIADKINITLPKEPIFPKYPLQEHEANSIDELIRRKAWDSLLRYLFKNPDLDANVYSMRLDEELDVITREGFSDYFIIEEDMIRATKEAGYLVGPGRGSAAGSLVSFMLGITTLDPIKLDLLFERFLNPERAGYPDCTHFLKEMNTVVYTGNSVDY